MSNNKEYMRVYMTKRYHRRRTAVLERLGGACASCGSTENLQIDHIDPKQKEVSWRQLSGMSEDKLEKEIKKSQLLCRSCHTDKTLSDLGRTRAVHGTLAMYQHHSCRCSECRKAQREYMRVYREKRKGRKHQGDAPAS